MAFVANPIVISSYFASLIRTRPAFSRTERLLRFPCNVGVAGLAVRRCACGSQLPAMQILPKLQDQIQRVKPAAPRCCVEYIGLLPQANSRRAASLRAFAS